MRFTRLHLCLTLMFCSQHLLGAQNASPVTYDANEGLIRLDVVVTDQAGKPVSGIAADDLTLLDDGKPAKILTFHAHDGISVGLQPPVTTILLVDTLNLPERLASFERREVRRFLQQNGGHLAQPVSLMEVSNVGILAVGQPSTDGNTLAAEFTHNDHLEWVVGRAASEVRGQSLDRANFESPGLSALKALGDIAAVERQLPGRKILIWVGPGWAVGSGVYLDSGAPKQKTFDAVEWFSTLLREARVSLYSFSVGETNADGQALSYVSFLGGLRAVQQASAMYLHRKVLAVQTGGRVLAPSADLIGGPAGGPTDFRQDADLVLQINSCIREASTFYSLSFDPLHADHPDQYHALRVQVNKPGLTARTTTGYYDQPYYSDQKNPAATPVTVVQLEQLIATTRDRSDAEQSRAIAELALTERLSRLKLSSLSTVVRGEKSRQALAALADASVFLNPPANEIPGDAAPDQQAQQRIVSLALQYLNKTVPNLPNFYARRTTVHYQENPSFEKGDAKITYQALHVADTVKDTVFYRNGSEVGESESGKNKKRKAEQSYLVTYGTFGPILRWTFNAVFATPNDLAWKRWENLAGRPVAVFDYVHPEGSSSYDTGGCCLPDGDGTSAFRSRVGYHGEVAIDPSTGAILRLGLIFDLTSTTPLDLSEIVIEYGPVEIAGMTYICPVRSVSISRGRSVVTLSETLNAQGGKQWRESFRTYGPYATMLNDITFDTFHLFHADSRMLTDVASADSHVSAKQTQETPDETRQASVTDSPVSEKQTDEIAHDSPQAGVIDSPTTLSGSAALAALSLDAPTVQELIPTGQNFSETPFEFVINVNRTIVPVVVRDKQGHTVGDLKKEDFQVFDNGKPRVIARFSVEKRDLAESGTSRAENNAGLSTQPQPAALPKRITLYLFDDLHLSPTDLAYLKKLDASALDGALVGSDMAAVASTSGKVNSGLTRDRAKLRDAITSLQSRSIFTASAGECPKIEYYQADLIENKHDGGAMANALAQVFACNPALDRQRDQDQAQSLVESAARRSLTVGEQDVRMTLATLKEYVRRMAKLPGQRTLVLVSPGFLSIAQDSLNTESQIMDLAVESNVTINALDASGLYTGVTDTSERGAGQIIDATHLAAMTRAEGVMSELANGTGGTFFHNNNDLLTGFKSVTDAPETVYMLEFSLDGVKPDGSFHRVDVKVDRHGSQIQARRGYAAPQQDKKK